MSENKSPKGNFIVQIGTKDPSLVDLFAGSGKVPEFGTHEPAPQSNFDFLDNLKRAATSIKSSVDPESGISSFTLVVDKFSAEDALKLSSMTNGQSVPLVEEFKYRGSKQNFQRVSDRVSKAKVENIPEELIGLDA